MCTYLTDIERKVADRDIEVYKIVLEENSVLRPPYQSGCIYASNYVKSWLETPRPCDALPVLPVHSKPMLVCEVNVGLHSFQNFKDAENVFDAEFFTFNHSCNPFSWNPYKYKIIKATIPEGSHYYLGIHHFDRNGEPVGPVYVSNNLILHPDIVLR